MARRTGRRSDYQWGNFGDQEFDQDLSTADAVYGTTGLIVGVASTIMRIRGRIGITLNSPAVAEHCMILCGLMIVTADHFAVGAAPELLTNGNDEASWIWTGSLYVSSGEEAAVTTDQASDTVEVDTKAMRKAKANDLVAFVFQAPAELVQDQAGTFNLTYWMHVLQAA